MNHWTFVTAAYAVVILASAGLALASFRAMRAAERAVEERRR